MSLTKKRPRTAKKIAASQANGRRSPGPSTAKGRERIRAAHLRHGFYAQPGEAALRALGEEPARFQKLREGLWEKWDPTDALQEELVDCQARAVWRCQRADRMQEGYAVRQAKEVNNSREDRLHAQMMRLKMTGASMQSLAQAVAREHYVTTPGDLEVMQSLREEGAVKERGEIALALFYQLREPGAAAPGEPDEVTDRQSSEAKSRAALIKIKEIFGLSSDTEPGGLGAPDSGQPQESREQADTAEVEAQELDLTAQEWEAREPVRQLLEHILMRQAELCEAQRVACLRECLAGPTPYERAAEIAPTHPNAALMQRMEDSSFRQVWRTTNLLLKIKRQAREEEDREAPPRT
ncbi:MAG: hypothetical protein ABSG32_26895 [Terriglobia bacterium]|jgi:hypothetical protein